MNYGRSKLLPSSNPALFVFAVRSSSLRSSRYSPRKWGRRDLNPRSTDISGRVSVLQRVVNAAR